MKKYIHNFNFRGISKRLLWNFQSELYEISMEFSIGHFSMNLFTRIFLRYSKIIFVENFKGIFQRNIFIPDSKKYFNITKTCEEDY